MLNHLSRRRLLVAAATAAPATLTGACFVQTRSRTTHVRPVDDIIRGTATADGAGVKLTRLLGSRRLPMLDPFLMLDEFHSTRREDFIKGFPSHPHRGFETVTLMLRGKVAHKDSVGNAGTITDNGVQWMTAGRGIVHSEMPDANQPNGELWGYQLWVNLPAHLKMTKPRYQDLTASVFETTQSDDAMVRVLAGQVGSTKGAITGIATAPTVLDITLEEGARFRHALPRGDNAFAYVVDGKTVMGEPEEAVSKGSIAVLGHGGEIAIRGLSASRVLLFSGAPIGEPVSRRGPFVMNTDAEIQQAFDDYRSGRLVGG